MSIEPNERRKKILIPLITILFIVATIYFVIISKSIADYRFFAGDKLIFESFTSSLSSLFTYKKQQMLFLVFELSAGTMLIVLVYLIVAKPEKFKSGVIEITPAIHIPAPAGQGQFGSKWFMEDINKLANKKPTFFEKIFKKETKIVFGHNVIDFNNTKIKNLINTGDEDIKENIEKLNSGVSITQIEEEIKSKRNLEHYKLKELQDEEDFKAKYNDFEDFYEDNTDLYNNFDLIVEQNNQIDISEYESDANAEDELLASMWVNEIKEKNEEELKLEKPYSAKDDPNKIFKSGGLITGIYKDDVNNKEDVYFVDKDYHSVILGATGSGKSRCLVLPTIGNLALAGESIVVTDPKGELYAYTSEFMKKLGYEVICLDFKNAKNSSKYNLLQPIINARKETSPEQPYGDIETIVKYSEELANMLIEKAKGENPMWTDNAKTMITGAILSLILENDDEKVQNMSNVYRFINGGEGKDINPNKDNLYLYIKALQAVKPESPIINAMLGIINTPTETRGGFSTNASSATRLFTQPSIWEITHRSNVDISKIGERKSILYIILPDEETSYYKIASIIVKQLYNELVKIADRKYGGRLPIRVNFHLDEFGNFAFIPDLISMLTVARSRGIRLNFYIQGFPQITKIYDKETTEMIKSNCEVWTYLKTMDSGTAKEVSEKLGSYTIYSNSESMSMQGNNTTSSSSSQSLQKRSLLLPEEIMAIDRPYLLIMMGNNKPAINQAPDISKLSFNKIFGMGDPDYNNQLRMIRDRQRPILKDNEEIKYWNIYSDIKNYLGQVLDPMHDEDEYIMHIAEYIKQQSEIKVA